jgi:alpha-beta hydrolase superfamily lysophospholipase
MTVDASRPGNRGEGTFLGAGSVDLYYQRWLPDASPRAIIALVHGFGDHSGRYGAVVDHFVPRGYAVYGLDLRGHGRSPGPRGHVMFWAEYREDVHAFLQFVRSQHPQTPLFLYGHSMGGLVALEFALHHPDGVAGVIASAPALAQTSASPLLVFLGRIVSRIWPGFGMTVTLASGGLSRDAEVNQAALADELTHSRATARFSTEFSGAMARTLEGAPSFKLPLLILQGTADQIVSPDTNRAFFDRVASPDKEWRQYEGGRHEPHNDVNAEEVMEDVERWLEARIAPS